MQREKFNLGLFRKRALQYRFVFLLMAVPVLFLPFIQPAAGTAPGIVYFMGRFHPLIIHFPVVLVLLVLVLEFVRRLHLWTVASTTIAFLLGAALLGSFAALGLGFMLYYTGEYVGTTMQQHLWGGVTLTAALAIALYFFLSYHRSASIAMYALYVSFLILANLALVFTSHQGGSLTHGSEYLTEYMPQFTQAEENWEPKPLEEMLVYEDMIVPFLDKKCMSCHNENKAKGGLIMTSYEALLKGGKSDHPTLTPGIPNESDMYRRVMLPAEDDDHMPPEGKVPLTQDEISLLTWWIEKGADPALKVQEASMDTRIQPLIETYRAELVIQQRARFMQTQSLEKLIQTVSTGGEYVLQVDPYEEATITLSMPFPSAAFEDEDLLSAQPLFPRISKASFIGSNITDDALYHIGQMTSLRELYLQQTPIKGEGLIYLSNLQNLKLLDLSKTNITDGQLLHVLRLPVLEDLYLNGTNISPAILEAIQQNQPDLNIHLERGDLF